MSRKSTGTRTSRLPAAATMAPTERITAQAAIATPATMKSRKLPVSPRERVREVDRGGCHDRSLSGIVVIGSR
ncbi:hypothetical protein HR12_08610 [Microbacterium sp. SUBG005]|nr:hypothetical protein HR12_08610 [Microbacterium sp. SUBG005]